MTEGPPQNNPAISDAEEIQADENVVEEEKELKAFLESFDFGLLQSLIEERIRPIGLEKDVYLVPANKIFARECKTGLGRFCLPDYKIDIDIRKLKKESTDKKERQIIFFHILIHEQVHAASVIDPNLQAGFCYSDDSPSGSKKNFKLWNEGVTEKLTRELVKQYLSSSNVPEEEKHYNYEFLPIPVSFLELVVKKISEHSGVDKEMVWNKILRAFFVKGTITEEDLEGVFHPDFYEELRNVGEDDLVHGPERINEYALGNDIDMDIKQRELHGSGIIEISERIEDKIFKDEEVV